MSQQNQQIDKEQLFRAKAAGYLVCFNSQCARHEHCLRWLLREYVPKDRLNIPCVNPHYSEVEAGHCPVFRSAKPVRMPVGLVWLYHDMPGWMERSIKRTLIHKYSRTRYYQYRNGSRPIPPDVEQFIRQLLIAEGWKDEPRFDSYTETYQW